MRKLLCYSAIAITTAFCAPEAKAQMPYNVTTLNEAYVPLANATNMTAGRVWSDTSEFEIPVGFSFQVGNSIISSLHFSQSNLFVSGNSGVQSGFAIMGTSLQDRSFQNGTPSSPIRYSVSGAAGSRIFKLELRNAGFANEWDKFGTSGDSVNLQVWIYESNSAFEFRFGPSHISHFADYFDKVPLGYFRNLNLTTFSFQKFYCLKGDPASPGMDTVLDIKNATGFTTYPASGRVYRFTPKGGTTSISDKESISLAKIYPVPVADVLNIEGDVDSYEILSLNGKVLASGYVSSGFQRVSLRHLPSGTYIIRLSNREVVGVKRFIKQ